MPSKKVYDFIVTLKHANYKFFNIISILMCLLAVLVSVLSLMYVQFAAPEWTAVALDIFIIVYLVFSYRFKNKKEYIVTFRWALSAGAILWFIPPQNNLTIALLYVVAAFLERQIKFPQEIGFDKDEIAINSFPSKHYTWEEIQNAVLKDNILTIDFKNNKILQKETEADVSTGIEKEFNEFCRKNLDATLFINFE